MIRAFLDHCDNSGNPFSDSNLIAAFIEALGSLRVDTGDSLVTVVKLVRKGSLIRFQPPMSCLPHPHRSTLIVVIPQHNVSLRELSVPTLS